MRINPDVGLGNLVAYYIAPDSLGSEGLFLGAGDAAG